MSGPEGIQDAVDVDVIHAAYASAWDPNSGTISPHDLSLVLVAAVETGTDMGELRGIVSRVTLGCEPTCIFTADLDAVVDEFLAMGFRHPLVPLISPRQIAALTACRRELGMSVTQFNSVMRMVGRAPSRKHLSGWGFMNIMEHFHELGARTPYPDHQEIERYEINSLHEAVLCCGIDHQSYEFIRCYFSGSQRSKHMSWRAYIRILTFLERIAEGVVLPAPRMPAEPGMISQPQANLIWKLWHDAVGWDRRYDGAALDRTVLRILGLTGGLPTLTKAGARKLIDRFRSQSIRAHAYSRFLAWPKTEYGRRQIFRVRCNSVETSV